MNDVSMMAVGLHASDEWLKRGLRQFERLYHESASITRIMSISIHPYLTGVPHRIGYLEELLDQIVKHDDVVFMTGEQIVDWYLGQPLAAGQVRRDGPPLPSSQARRRSAGRPMIAPNTVSLRMIQPKAALKHASAASWRARPSMVSTQSSMITGA